MLTKEKVRNILIIKGEGFVPKNKISTLAVLNVLNIISVFIDEGLISMDNTVSELSEIMDAFLKFAEEIKNDS